jgi:hypothetical protein
MLTLPGSFAVIAPTYAKVNGFFLKSSAIASPAEKAISVAIIVALIGACFMSVLL